MSPNIEILNAREIRTLLKLVYSTREYSCPGQRGSQEIKTYVGDDDDVRLSCATRILKPPTSPGEHRVIISSGCGSAFNNQNIEFHLPTGVIRCISFLLTYISGLTFFDVRHHCAYRIFAKPPHTRTLGRSVLPPLVVAAYHCSFYTHLTPGHRPGA